MPTMKSVSWSVVIVCVAMPSLWPARRLRPEPWTSRQHQINYSMASDSIPGAADAATKAENTSTSAYTKRKRAHYQGDDAITLALGAKRRRVNPTILQPRDSNIQLQVQVTQSSATPPSSLEDSHLLREFEYSESEIRILKVIGSGDHSISRFKQGEGPKENDPKSFCKVAVCLLRTIL